MRRDGYERIYGIEPSLNLAALARKKGLIIAEKYFETSAVEELLERYGAPQLVLCRHTLEHVPDPVAFMHALAALLQPRSGTALVEVPDSTMISEHLKFIEFWDEHLYYFSPHTLRRLFEKCGLTVLTETALPHLDTRNIMMRVVAGASAARSAVVDVDAQEARMWESFRSRFGEVSAEISREILSMPRPLYLIGASHPQCNFVNYLGIEAVADFMIDDDPAKVGRLPPIRSQQARIITSDDFLVNANQGTLLLTGFGYQNWTQRLCEVGRARGLVIFDPQKRVMEEADQWGG